MEFFKNNEYIKLQRIERNPFNKNILKEFFPINKIEVLYTPETWPLLASEKQKKIFIGKKDANYNFLVIEFDEKNYYIKIFPNDMFDELEDIDNINILDYDRLINARAKWEEFLIKSKAVFYTEDGIFHEVNYKNIEEFYKTLDKMYTHSSNFEKYYGINIDLGSLMFPKLHSAFYFVPNTGHFKILEKEFRKILIEAFNLDEKEIKKLRNIDGWYIPSKDYWFDENIFNITVGFNTILDKNYVAIISPNSKKFTFASNGMNIRVYADLYAKLLDAEKLNSITQEKNSWQNIFKIPFLKLTIPELGELLLKLFGKNLTNEIDYGEFSTITIESLIQHIGDFFNTITNNEIYFSIKDFIIGKISVPLITSTKLEIYITDEIKYNENFGFSENKYIAAHGEFEQKLDYYNKYLKLKYYIDGTKKIGTC